MNEKGNRSSASQNAEYEKWASLGSEDERAYRQSEQGEKEFLSAMTFEREMNEIATDYANNDELRRRKEELALKRALQRDATARKQYANGQAIRAADKYYSSKIAQEPAPQPTEAQPTEPTPQSAETPATQPAETQPTEAQPTEPQPVQLSPEAEQELDNVTANINDWLAEGYIVGKGEGAHKMTRSEADQMIAQYRERLEAEARFRAAKQPTQTIEIIEEQPVANTEEQPVNAEEQPVVVNAEGQPTSDIEKQTAADKKLSAQALIEEQKKAMLAQFMAEQAKKAEEQAERQAREQAQQQAERQAEAQAQAILSERQADIDQLVQSELDARGQLDSAMEAKKALEAKLGAEQEPPATEEQPNLTTEELAKLEADQLAALQAERQALMSKLGSDKPLVAINANFTHDAKEIAYDVAKTAFDAKTAKANFIRKIWRNTFQKAYIKSYEKKFLSGKLKDEHGRTLEERLEASRASTMERFTLATIDDEYRSAYLHENIGTENQDRPKKERGQANGEKLAEADAETTAKVRTAIETFFKEYKEQSPNMSDAELSRGFREVFKRLNAEDQDAKKSNGTYINNYGEVAINALKSYQHFEGLQSAMEGFKVYNADVRNNVRTDAHRDALDRIINKLEGSALGRYIPAEALAAAAGLTTFLTSTGARAIAGAAGGIVGSSVIAGLKERNRVTEDRTTKLRNLAYGMEYTSGEEDSDNSKRVNRRLAKSAKYEAKIGGTIYPLEKATELTQNIYNALALPAETPDRSRQIMEAIRNARVRIAYSDEHQKDLIAYSSSDKCGDERLALDKAVFEARKTLSDDEKATLGFMEKVLEHQITEDYEQANDKFAKLRRGLVAKKVFSTALIGTANYFVSQEAIVAISPDKIGVLEKAGVLKTKNNLDAKETVLASGFGKLRGSYNIEAGTHESAPLTTSDPNRVAQLEADGYKVVSSTEGVPGVEPTVDYVSPAESTANIEIARDGWANNGTSVADGNELRVHILDGKFVSTMHGNSSMGNQVFSYEDLVAEDRIKGFLTIGGGRFEVLSSVDEAGHLTWGENGIFQVIAPDGTISSIQAISDNGEKLYKYFEIAMDNGWQEEGGQLVRHIVPFATDAGRNSFAGTLTQAVEGVAEIPATYTLTKTITDYSNQMRDIYMGGLGFAFRGRTGLGTARPLEVNSATPQPNASQSASNATEPVEPAPSATPEPPVVESQPAPSPTTPEPAPQPNAVQPQPNATQPQPENRPQQPENQPQESAAEATDRLRQQIENASDLIGEEGVQLLSADQEGTVDVDRYDRWWNGLNDAQKQSALDLMRQLYETTNKYQNNAFNLGDKALTWYLGYNQGNYQFQLNPEPEQAPAPEPTSEPAAEPAPETQPTQEPIGMSEAEIEALSNRTQNDLVQRLTANLQEAIRNASSTIGDEAASFLTNNNRMTSNDALRYATWTRSATSAQRQALANLAEGILNATKVGVAPIARSFMQWYENNPDELTRPESTPGEASSQATA